MHTYASGEAIIAVGHPASPFAVPQSVVAGGAAGSVATTGPVVVDDSLVLEVVVEAAVEGHVRGGGR